MAELSWVRSVVDDLRAGWLRWDEEWLPEVATAWSPPDDGEIRTEPPGPIPALDRLRSVD
jgi:hypothetical protein